MRVVGGALLLGLVLLAQGGSAQPPRKQSTPATSRDSPGSLSPEKVAGKTLDQWIKDLSDADASIRTQAVMALPQFGDRAHKAVPELLKRLNDRDVSPRARAVMTLRVIAVAEKDVPKVVTALAARIQPSNQGREVQASVRYEAVITLRRFLEDAQPAIPALITGTLDPASWELRYISVQTLWRAGNGPLLARIRIAPVCVAEDNRLPTYGRSLMFRCVWCSPVSRRFDALVRCGVRMMLRRRQAGGSDHL